MASRRSPAARYSRISYRFSRAFFCGCVTMARRHSLLSYTKKSRLLFGAGIFLVIIVYFLLDHLNCLAVSEANDVDALLERVNLCTTYSVDACDVVVGVVNGVDAVCNAIAELCVSCTARDVDVVCSCEVLTVESTVELNSIFAAALIVATELNLCVSCERDCAVLSLCSCSSELNITASDSDNIIKSTIALTECEGEGEFCVPTRVVIDALKELPEQPLSFEVEKNSDAYAIKIVYQNGLYNFTGINAEDYPRSQPMGDGCTVITLSTDILIDNISRSLFATASDELRPVMNGIYFDLTPEPRPGPTIMS